MGLVIDMGSARGGGGKVYRIDLTNGQVTTPNGKVQLAPNGTCARFSPDGTQFAHTVGNSKVQVRVTSTGDLVKEFAATGSYLSWTKNGIWTHSSGRTWIQYDPTTGNKTRTLTIPTPETISYSYISYNEKTLAGFCRSGRKGHPSCKNGVNAIFLDQNNFYKPIAAGCGVCPSPDGMRLTANLWESGREHRTMKIFTRDGRQVKHMALTQIIPGTNNSYVWNFHKWSSNSNSIICIPVGLAQNNQINGNMIPYIHNISTNKTHCLYRNNRDRIFWCIHDFYEGNLTQILGKEWAAPQSRFSTAIIENGIRGLVITPTESGNHSIVVTNLKGRVVWSKSVCGGRECTVRTVPGTYVVAIRGIHGAQVEKVHVSR